ncbi:43583_t:CDS:1, partial [Gigaspora margarita]
ISLSSNSQIDNIWYNQELLLDLERPTILDVEYITNSDYQIVLTR